MFPFIRYFMVSNHYRDTLYYDYEPGRTLKSNSFVKLYLLNSDESHFNFSLTTKMTKKNLYENNISLTCLVAIFHEKINIIVLVEQILLSLYLKFPMEDMTLGSYK